MMRLATEWCSIWCPDHPPCRLFVDDNDNPGFCGGCDHREVCHHDTDKADEEGTYDGEPRSTGGDF